MGLINVETKGDFKDTTKFLEYMKSGKIYLNLDQYGRRGVDALSSATPVRTGMTAASWGYQIHQSGTTISISWFNTHVEHSVNIAVIIQYGHGTGTGGFVQGIDYINPAMRSLFDKIAQDIWRQVTSA